MNEYFNLSEVVDGDDEGDGDLLSLEEVSDAINDLDDEEFVEWTSSYLDQIKANASLGDPTMKQIAADLGARLKNILN